MAEFDACVACPGHEALHALGEGGIVEDGFVGDFDDEIEIAEKAEFASSVAAEREEGAVLKEVGFDGFFPEIEQPFVGGEGECVGKLQAVVVLVGDFGEFVSQGNEAVVDVFYGFWCYKALLCHEAFLCPCEREIRDACTVAEN